MVNSELLERAQQLGANLDRKRAKRIFVTGVAQITPFGDTEQTHHGVLDPNGSAVVSFPEAQNAYVNIAAPVKFNPRDYFDRRELRGVSTVAAMAGAGAKKAATMAKLIDENGQLNPDARRQEIGSWVGTGVAATQRFINVYHQLHGEDGQGDPTTNSKGASLIKALEIFPEQVNAFVTRVLGISNWGGSTVEACATGLSNIIEAAETIKRGDNKAAIAGGFEEPFDDYPEVAVAMFSQRGVVLSTRNDEPEKASRPFDKDRDGFVEGAGGGVVILDEEEHADRRGAPKLAEVLAFRKSMDGGISATGLDVDNVARTILETLWNEERKEFIRVDAIFAHATSTVEGDLAEAAVLRRVFGDKLKDIPITAIKSHMGHLLGGAGAVNFIAAVFALNDGKVPPIANLENPDPEFSNLFLVRGEPLERPIKTALVLAYGFGAYNAVAVLGKVGEDYYSEVA